MSFEGFIGELVTRSKSDEKSEPLCMMKDHPELVESFKFFTREMDAFDERKKVLNEERESQRKKFWQTFELRLIELGFLTQKEVDNDCGLKITDGVLFKQTKVVEESNRS